MEHLITFAAIMVPSLIVFIILPLVFVAYQIRKIKSKKETFVYFNNMIKYGIVFIEYDRHIYYFEVIKIF